MGTRQFPRGALCARVCADDRPRLSERGGGGASRRAWRIVCRGCGLWRAPARIFVKGPAGLTLIKPFGSRAARRADAPRGACQPTSYLASVLDRRAGRRILGRHRIPPGFEGTSNPLSSPSPGGPENAPLSRKDVDRISPLHRPRHKEFKFAQSVAHLSAHGRG